MSAIAKLRNIPNLEWVNFKGENVVIQWNLEATKKARKPMVDISHCLTKALNNIVIKTVQWDKSKFKPSNLNNPIRTT